MKLDQKLSDEFLEKAKDFGKKTATAAGIGAAVGILSVGVIAGAKIGAVGYVGYRAGKAAYEALTKEE